MRLKIEDVVHPDARDMADDFECPICCNLFEEPVQLLCTGRHIFCAECVKAGAFLACPTCREPLPSTGKKFVPLQEPQGGSPAVFRMMLKLKCRCPHHDGPAFAERLTNTSGAKEADDAQSADIGGAARSSSVAYPKKRPRVDSDDLEMEGGEEQGPKKCAWTGQYGDLIGKHLNDCGLHPVECPRGCGAVVRRRGLEKHAVVCKANFDACGICGELVKPEDMQAHRSSAAETHVQILDQKLTDRDKTISQLEKTTGDAQADLWKQIRDLNKVVGDVKAEMSSKTHTNNATKRNADRILFDMNDHVIVNGKAMRDSVDSIKWTIKTAELFAKCKAKGTALASPTFFVRGHGPFKMQVLGLGGAEAETSENMGFFVEDNRPSVCQRDLTIRLGFTFLGSEDDASKSNSVDLWSIEGQPFYFGPTWKMWGFPSAPELNVNKVKAHPALTFKLRIVEIEHELIS